MNLLTSNKYEAMSPFNVQIYNLVQLLII